MREDLLDFTIRASAFLKVVAGRTRSLLIWELLDGEKSVTALADAVGASATAVSQQLAILKGEGLVSSRRCGQKVFYSLTSEEARRFVSSILEILRHNASTSDTELAQPQAA